MFSWREPKDESQLEHNRKVMKELDLAISNFKKGKQPENENIRVKSKNNFIQYFEKYLKEKSSRASHFTLKKFKQFLVEEKRNPNFIEFEKIDKKFCLKFQDYLMANLTGVTPGHYFGGFKKILSEAHEDRLFDHHPAQYIRCKRYKCGRKDTLEKEVVEILLKADCRNPEVKRAAIVSIYTGLRWCDVSKLKWEDITCENVIKLKQSKTDELVEIPLHRAVAETLGKRGAGLVFKLPQQIPAMRTLRNWVKNVGIQKEITWHSLRHTCSILLQDLGVPLQTVAKILGHPTTANVFKTYQNSKLIKMRAAINML